MRPILLIVGFQLLKVLDLFCGAGGLALGFKKAGFEVTGVDISDCAGSTFELNRAGKFIKADLSRESIRERCEVVIGGPPCKPWSAVNTQKRGKNHGDYLLVARFLEHIERLAPKMFLMENVPSLAGDPILQTHIDKLSRQGYSVTGQCVRYSDYGAPISRHRLVVVGAKDNDAQVFFRMLHRYRKPASTVRAAIWDLRKTGKGDLPDHEWPELKTIGKYRDYYKTRKYGWYVLEWKKPAPSFGNVMKTYILHPDAFDGGPTRVISVKEASLIMGFSKKFRFPSGYGLGIRYQMVADSVSPVFSRVAARIVSQMLHGSRGHR